MEPSDVEIADGLKTHRENGEQLARYFAFAHLQMPLREVSKHFAKLALLMLDNLPRNAERTAGLRKLIEAKDCAVRAALPE